jgi:hypothetical protein
MRSKLIVGAVAAACALSALTMSAVARVGHNSGTTPVTFDSSPPNCGSGAVPILHMMNVAAMHWGCVDATGKAVSAHAGNLSSRHR